MSVLRRQLPAFVLGCVVTLGVAWGWRAIRTLAAPSALRVVDHDFSDWIDADAARLAGRYSFLDLARFEAGEIHIPSGEHELLEDVVLPRGKRVFIAAGATLRLAPGVSLISYSPVDALGADEPIRFERLDPERAFGVIGVLQGNEGSRFRGVHVIGASEASVAGVRLTGALSIHGGRVSIASCRFADNEGEDGVNLRGVKGQIEGSDFLRNAGDGLDLDDSRAQVVSNRFDGNRKDAIDTSRSVAVIAQNRFRASRRCLALGEKSRVELRGNEFSDCGLNIHVDSTSVLEVVTFD